ncbi:MAG: hypothetical protein JEZ07_03550 [Phycisphaerae bacterium]|nr:hypothetical protein [Phycisphaerae bacterium]
MFLLTILVVGVAIWGWRYTGDLKYDNRVYVFGIYHLIGCPLLAGLIGVVLPSIYKKHCKTFLGILLLITFCFSSIIFLASNDAIRRRNGFDSDARIQLGYLHRNLFDYMHCDGKIPSTDNWYEQLKKVAPKDDMWQLRDENNFVLNVNIVGKSIQDIPGNVILLIECDKNMAAYGGRELLDIERKKDKYFTYQKDRFIYLCFMDGTIAKYRIADGAIAEFNINDAISSPDYINKDGHSPYIKDSKYLPLQWGSPK